MERGKSMKFILSFLLLFFVSFAKADHPTNYIGQASSWLLLVRDYQYKNDNPNLAMMVWSASYLGNSNDVDGAMLMCYAAYYVALQDGENDSAYVIACSYLYYLYSKNNVTSSLFSLPESTVFGKFVIKN